MRGRKPKPTALKRIDGNPGKRPIPTNEPQPDPTMPRRPKHLAPAARRLWRKLVPELARLGLLTSIDGNAIARYCQAHALYLDAQEAIAKNGATQVNDKNVLTKSPWVEIANGQAEIMRKIETEFGLTPTARARTTAGNPAKGPGDALADFCKGFSGPAGSL